MIMDKYYSCFFTGHRIISGESREQLSLLLEQKIKNLVENYNINRFICGGAVGFDTMAARAVIRAKMLYPNIKLCLYLPCYDQCKKWKKADREIWRELRAEADVCRYITEGNYVDGCMQKRNRKMADDSAYCIAYCINSRSGTGAAIRYAETRAGCIVENLADYMRF